VFAKIIKKLILLGWQSVLVKVAAMYRDILLISMVGFGLVIEEYLLVLIVPSFVSTLFSSPIAAAFTRQYIAVKESNVERSRLFFMSSVVLFCQVLIFLCLYYLVLLFADIEFFGLSLLLISEGGRELFLLSFAFSLLYSLSVLLGAILNAEGFYSLNLSTQLMVPLVMIFMLYFSSEQLDAVDLSWMRLCGGGMHAAFLIMLLLKYKWVKCFSFLSLDLNIVKEVVRQQLPLIATSVTIVSATYIDSLMASNVGEGALSVYSYGTKVSIACGGVAVIGLGSYLLPHFSHRVEEGRIKELKHEFKLLSLVFLVFGCLGCYVMSQFSFDILSLLIGDAMDTQNIEFDIVSLQAASFFTIPFFLLNTVSTRMITALHMNRQIVLVTAFALIINIVLNFVLSYFVGVIGIVLSTMVVYGFLVIAINIKIYRKLDFLNGNSS